MSRPGTAVGGFGRTPLVIPTSREISAWLLARSLNPLFHVYVYLLVLLPSGSIFHVNVKILCFVLLLPPTFHALFRDRTTSLRALAVLPAVTAGLALWVLLGQGYAANLGLSGSEYKDVWTTLSSCWLVAVYCKSKRGRHVSFLRTILYAEALASFIKLGLLAYCFARGISVALMVDQINLFFGVNLMGMEFESALGRIQFIADGLIPLCLYMLLRYRHKFHLSVPVSLAVFAIMALSLAFSFSRYLWAFGAFAVCIGFLVSKWDRLHAWLLTITGVAILAALPAIVTLYQLRFSADVAGESDSVRTGQIPALNSFFLDAPILGHGLGTYTSEVIRSGDTPYLYEVQILALAGQLGMLGLGLLILLMVQYFWPLLPRTRASLNQNLTLVTLLMAWLAAGLFNPMLLNSAAAMSFATLRELAFIEDSGNAVNEGEIGDRAAITST